MKKNLLYLLGFVIIFSSIYYFASPGNTPSENMGNNDPSNNSSENEGQSNEQPESAGDRSDLSSDQTKLNIPDGFVIKEYSNELGKVRDIVSAPGGIIVSAMDRGQVVYLPDADGDFYADQKKILADDLYNPHGMLEYCAGESNCRLYIAETNAITVFDYDKEKMTIDNPQKIVDLPDDGGHYTRHLALYESDGQDKLLITVGSSCNVCEESDWRRAKILQSDLDGSNLEEFATGLRNSVFMKKNPATGEVWAGDMGRDWLGDNLPPEEVNIIREGNDYGWPYCYGDKIHDTNFDDNTYVRDPCADTTAPIIKMTAHSAPLGLDFFSEEAWSEEYQYDMLLAQHGSWNRTTPAGYKIVRMNLDSEGNFSGQEDFVTGFLDGGTAWARPADIEIKPNGLIYFTDDFGGRVYVLVKK